LASGVFAAELNEDARPDGGSSAVAKFSVTTVVTWDPVVVSTRVLDVSIAIAAAALYLGCFLLDLPLLEEFLLEFCSLHSKSKTRFHQ